MPNYVSNVVKILCPDGNAKDVKEFLASDERVFDFEKIIPVPPTMHMVSGSLTNAAIAAYLSNNCTLSLDESLRSAETIGRTAVYSVENFYERTKADIEKNGVDKLYNFGSSANEMNLTYYAAGEIYCENLLNYGAVDWYDFHCRNWGTKWNACEPDLVSESETELSYFFDTAWSMPYPIFCKITEIFQNITIEVEYADEDFGSNCGRITYQGGGETDSYIPDNYKEAQELAAEILGYDLTVDFKYSEKLGHYVWAEYFEEVEAEYDAIQAEKAKENSENSAEETKK